MITNLSLAFEMLNQENKLNILTKRALGSFEELVAAADNYTEDELEKLEKDIIEQFCLMDKNRIYILCKVNGKDGDKDFAEIKAIYVNNKMDLFNDCDKEESNWFEIEEKDPNKRKFAFYRIKTRKWKNDDGEIQQEDKLLVYQCELLCFGGIIWVILKMPLIGLDNSKPYKFEEERNHIFYWFNEFLNIPLKLLPLKEFYENFKDEPPLEKTGWNARSYKDENNEITEGDFGIKLDYQCGLELNKVYKSINANFGPDYNAQLELSFIDYCKQNNIEISDKYLDFFRESDNLLNSELIFRGIQSKCEYLVGTIGYFIKYNTGEKKEKIRYYIEKIKDETSGLIRITHQGDEHFKRIFSKIKECFDGNTSRMP